MLNKGSDTLVINDITIEGPDAADFSIITEITDLKTIYPEREHMVGIVFTPSTIGEKSARLLIPSNDSREPVISVDLWGTVSNIPVSPPVSSTVVMPESGNTREALPDWALIFGVIVGGITLVFVIVLLLRTHNSPANEK